MEQRSIDAILRGEYSVERFWGQTVLYLPGSISVVPEEKRVAVVHEFFPKFPLDNLNRAAVEDFHNLPAFYCVEIPSVLVMGKKGPLYEVPDKIGKALLALSRR